MTTGIENRRTVWLTVENIEEAIDIFRNGSDLDIEI
jgi:hypothetical protein